ncbi:MAG: hypothetical protein QNJ81_07380 [Acidimicrobiia bacterium]|nr:hypothetical protein [Acidimicrobiia bacterium]
MRTTILVAVVAVLLASCAASEGDATSNVDDQVASQAAFGVVETWGGEGLADMSPPALVVEISGLKHLEMEGALATFEAEVLDVLYVDSARPEVKSPAGTVRLWANLNTTWVSGADVGELMKSVAETSVVILGYQDNTAAYDDLRSWSTYSIMAIVGLGEDASFAGPGVEGLNADLNLLAETWSGTTSELIAEFAAQLRQREDARLASDQAPQLSLIDQLVEPEKTPEEEYWALSDNSRDVHDAPESIRATLLEREVFVEVVGGSGHDDIAIGVQSEAGWSGGAVTSLQGATWPGLFDPDSTIKVFLYDFGRREIKPLVIQEITLEEWKAEAGLHIQVPATAIHAYRDGETVKTAGVQVSTVAATELRDLRNYVASIVDESGGEVDEEPLPSELIGSEEETP